jgi:uncharacterized protein (TIGR04255 family)
MPSVALPIAGHNAVESAAFVFGFGRPFALKEVEALFSLEARARDELPSYTTIQTLQFNLAEPSQGPSAPASQQVTGVLLQKFRPDGKPEWVLRADGNQIVVNCTRYTRWADVWASSRRFLLMAAQSVDAPTNGVTTFALQFTDKFVYAAPPPSDYSPAEVFKVGSKYLTAQASSSGMQWHVHQGWFIDQGDLPLAPTRTLHVLNLSSAILEDRLTAIVDHTAHIQLKEGKALRVKALLGGDDDPLGGSSLVNSVFTSLHQQNLEILRETLSVKQVAAIGMDPE